MAAVYPGEGTRYCKHVDNPGGAQGNGRVLTLLVYLNPDWEESHGGSLRLYPALHESMGCAIVHPLFNRWGGWQPAQQRPKTLCSATSCVGLASAALTRPLEPSRGRSHDVVPHRGPLLLLHLFPQRLAGFYSDRRTPHEVTSAMRERAALSVWYSDSLERMRALAAHSSGNTG